MISYIEQEPPYEGGNISALHKHVSGEHVLTVPIDEANSDYQAYLAWVAEGNEPQPWNPEP